MLLPNRIPVPLRPGNSDARTTRSILKRNSQGPPNAIFIVVGIIAAVIVIVILVYCFSRYKMGAKSFTSKRGKYHQPEDSESLNSSSTPSARRRDNGTTSSGTVRSSNPTTSTSQVDRNTSIRSIMTLPAYRTKANETEQVIGREGERDGVDVVVECPTAEEEENMRDEEMEALYQVRRARREENAARDERRRLQAEARARGDALALEEIRAQRRAAHESTLIDDLREAHEQVKDRRQRAVSSVSYHELGVAQMNGTRLRANSQESERVGLLSDAASIDVSRRSASAQSHHRDRSASSVLSFDSELPSPGLRSNAATPQNQSYRARAGSSPEIIDETDLGVIEMPPPDYDDVSLDDTRSGAATPVINEPPPEYTDPTSERDRRLSAHVADMVDSVEESGDLSNANKPSNGRPMRSSYRSSRGVGGAPQLPSLRIGRLPQIVIEPSTAHPNDEHRADPDPGQAAAGAGATPAPSPVPDGGLDAWLQVLGAFAVMVNTWGLVNSFGVFQTYYETELLRSSTASAISWIGSLQGALLMLGGLVSGPLFDRGYFRALTGGGLFLVVFGLFMTSLCGEDKYWQVLLAHGVCVGVGCGLLFLPSAAILSQYFARRRALALGVQSAGSPLAGIVFPLVFGSLQPRLGFGWATRVIAFIMLALSALPFIFMRPRLPLPPPHHGRAFFDASALREPPFLAFGAAGLGAFLGLYVPFFYLPLWALRHGVAGFPVAYFVTLLNAGSVAGRLLPNLAADYVGAMPMLAATTLGAAALALAWLGIRDMGGAVAFAVLFGFFNGGVTSLPPSAVVALTPDLGRLGTRMGMVFAFMGLAVLVGTPIAGAILGGGEGEGAWDGLVAFSGGTLFLGAVGFAGSLVLLRMRERRVGKGL
ncbi:MFS general substrate transporter [Whalleya microplaca]|nr:MFS general substrate transporter [Whalleya microplaca]